MVTETFYFCLCIWCEDVLYSDVLFPAKRRVTLYMFLLVIFWFWVIFELSNWIELSKLWCVCWFALSHFKIYYCQCSNPTLCTSTFLIPAYILFSCFSTHCICLLVGLSSLFFFIKWYWWCHTCSGQSGWRAPIADARHDVTVTHTYRRQTVRLAWYPRRLGSAGCHTRSSGHPHSFLSLHPGLS